MSIDVSRIRAQRALEALRNGVPNADAVFQLGCMQPEAFDHYREQLEHLRSASDGGGELHSRGTLLRGDFGSGKSHTLAYFEQEALKQNFVVSRLVVSKETPLHDPRRLFEAAIRNARLPNSRGAVVHELATLIDYQSPAAKPFLDWALKEQPYKMLTASVLIDMHSHDAELKHSVLNWWSGEKLSVSEVREGMKLISTPLGGKLSAIKMKDLPPLRFELLARLVRAAGFSGWVLLIDELELLAKFSLLQRGRAYAELAKWLGLFPRHHISGISVVGAITDDYSLAVLIGKDDQTNAPERLKQKGDEHSLALSTMAASGIEHIRQHCIPLHAPSDAELRETCRKLARLYSEAYVFEPQVREWQDGRSHRNMRSHVRRWICEWDLQRLYGERTPDFVEERPLCDASQYEEDSDVQSVSADGEAE